MRALRCCGWRNFARHERHDDGGDRQGGSGVIPALACCGAAQPVRQRAKHCGNDQWPEHQAGGIAEFAGKPAASAGAQGAKAGAGFEYPIVEDQQAERDQGHRVGQQSPWKWRDRADARRGVGRGCGWPATVLRFSKPIRCQIRAHTRGLDPFCRRGHSYTLPGVSDDGKQEQDKSDKQSDSTKQLEAAESAAKERFERAMNELRDGAYRFANRARTQSELIIEELIDPEGETVESLAEVEGDTGAAALSQSLELITFDTWLFGQIGDQRSARS